MKVKQVQIPEALMNNIIIYFLNGQKSASVEQDIVRGLEEKLDRMIEHDYYTQYKTAPTPEQREEYRQKYLDKKCIPESYRWSAE